jgi:type I restriction enzyme S subunit
MTQAVLLGDLINIKSGKSRPKEVGNFPVYGGNGIFDSAPMPNMSEPTVIVGRVGAYCGSVYVENKPFWLSDNALGVTAKEGVDLNFIYYLLKSIDLNARSVGGAQPLLTQGILNKISVTVPELRTQKKIADILGKIDEKIELNRKMNETLEQMGQALFRHYFIDNPEAEKWKNKTLEDISTTITRGFTAKYADKSNIINLNQKVNKGSVLDKQYFKYYVPDTVVPADKFAKDGDILINSLGQGTLGRVHHYIENTDNVVVDQHITIVRSNLHNYLYYRLAYFDNQRLQSMISGTTGMLMLNISKIRQFKLPDPGEDREVLDKFDRAVDSFNEQKNKNNQEIQTLTTLRDTLLPRLISGKVNIK